MDVKMESEHSYSGESSSSSGSSSGSSDAEEEVMEPVRILGHNLELPQELCEDYSVFKEFFSLRTWEALDDKHKDHLKNFLPKFTENDEEEKEKTIKKLFNHEPFHFTSPLGDFYDNLRQGNYRPDIAKMKKFLKRARAKQQRHKIKSYYAKLLPEVLLSRERLLAAAKAAPPGPVPSVPVLPPKPSSKNNYKSLYLRVKQRYFEELTAIRGEVEGEDSEDENYPEGPPEPAVKKRKYGHTGQNVDSNVSGTLCRADSSHPTSLQCLKNVLAAHRARRQYRENHPELNTVGISLDDIKQRVALVNGTKKLMFGGQKTETPIQKLRRGSKKESVQRQNKSEAKTSAKKVKEEHESIENKPLLPNIKIKCERADSDSEASSFVDPVSSPKQSKMPENVEVKQEGVDIKHPDNASINYKDSTLEGVIKQEPKENVSVHNTRTTQPIPIKLEDLDGIDMMALPVELADDSGEVLSVDTSTETREDVLVDADESLTETTHANFLALVRALFPAKDAHRASKQQLHARCAAVMRSPIAPLNTWYSLSDDWCAELDSALDFLAGERGPHPDDFVPYLQYKPETQMYQWIGAGRDCDALLARLCERWLRAATPPPLDSDPPPPRYPTTWVIRLPTSSELAEFRAQERRRYSTPAKAFTYVQHGYRSVVGPCPRGGSGSGSAVLNSPRPRHASLTSLVRDAVARLPNGEGSTHDVFTLLKMSQWIASCSDQVLLSALSSVMDRLQSAKRDPIIKYDHRTAVWIYLHRYRSEEDWLKSVSGRSRGSKASTSPTALPAAPSPTATKQSRQQTPSAAIEMEVAGVEEVIDYASDSDVDVEDSGAPPGVSHLSSAQLLMQATQASQAKQLQQIAQTHKPKGKLVATSPQKPKTKQTNLTKTTQVTKQGTPQSKQSNSAQSIKQTNPTTQSTQQSNLISQSIKQANLLAQSVKQASLIVQSTKSSLINQIKQGNSTTQVMKRESSASQLQKPSNPTQSSEPGNKHSGLLPQSTLTSHSAKQVNVLALTKQNLTKQANVVQTKQVNITKQILSTETSKIKESNVVQITKPVQLVKQNVPSHSVKQVTGQVVTQVSKSSPSLVEVPRRSPLLKQRPLQKVEAPQTLAPLSNTSNQQVVPMTPTVIQPVVTSVHQNQTKLAQGTRSLLIKSPAVQTTVTAAVTTVAIQATPTSRRGVVRVLSPAASTSGKSLISPQALLQQATPTSKKRPIVPTTVSVTTVAQTTANVTTVVSSVPTIVTSSMSTRTVQLAGGRTVQLAANQTVHLPGGQAVQLASGHTLQLSSLQLPTHSVRLPSGQTVQLASPQAIQTVRAVSTTAIKNSSPRGQQSSPIIKTNTPTSQSLQIPVSTVQLAGQTVQIAGQSVQLAGQTVQLTGHTVKLPSGQSVQVASQSVLPSQSVQLSTGQTVQLASGNVQTVQLGGQNVQMPSGQSVQLGTQTVQIAGQTVQLAGGQTVQLPSGQTLQLPSGQTVQLSSGQTLQLANQTPKSIAQVVRTQPAGEKTAQPIVAKLLTNAQGQMLSLESVVGARGLTPGGRGRGVRVLPPATRLARPLLLTAAKPLHNIILQQSDGSAIRVTSSGVAAPSQTIVLGNIGTQAVSTSTTTTPVLKLQQVSSLQQVKLPQGFKIQQGGAGANVATSSGVTSVRSVLVDGQQLKLVGGRHVLARLLRPAHPPQ